MHNAALASLVAALALPAVAGAQAPEVQTPAVAVQAESAVDAAAPAGGTLEAAPPEAEAEAEAEAEQGAIADEAEQPTLDELRWTARPVVVFADSPSDPRFLQQVRMLEERIAELEERLVVVLTDTRPAEQGPLREALRPRGFGLVLLDTDGSVAQRRPAPTSAREILNLIDRLPSRRQESGSFRP